MRWSFTPNSFSHHHLYRTMTHRLLNNLNMPVDMGRGFLKRLQSVFAQMDNKYRQVADYYQFHCMGCDDNCCATHFYHHTVIEYLYLRSGFDDLPDDKRKRIRDDAGEVYRQWRVADSQKYERKNARIMCPLNFDGLCVVYAHRPMICRLHGLPHELCKPGAEVIQSPGCDAFVNQCQRKSFNPAKFDRTPFYRQIAILEQDLRKTAEFTSKIKMTVAEMIVAF